MYKRLLISSLVTLLYVCAASDCVVASVAQENLEAEEYAVYSAVIDELSRGWGASGRVTLRIEKDFPSSDVYARNGHEYVKAIMREVSQEVRDDYEAKNKLPYELKSLFDIRVPYVLVSSKARWSQPQKGASRKMAEPNHRSSSMTLSRVGFNAKADQALVYVGLICGRLCGSGSYVMLAKENGVWRVERRRAVWKS